MNGPQGDYQARHQNDSGLPGFSALEWRHCLSILLSTLQGQGCSRQASVVVFQHLVCSTRRCSGVLWHACTPARFIRRPPKLMVCRYAKERRCPLCRAPAPQKRSIQDGAIAHRHRCCPTWPATPRDSEGRTHYKILYYLSTHFASTLVVHSNLVVQHTVLQHPVRFSCWPHGRCARTGLNRDPLSCSGCM